MNDGIKNTIAVLGSFIFLLFILFCIGMNVTSFRNKVYDIMDVVSEQEYLSITECNTMLLDEITENENELLRMTSEKTRLEARITELQDTHSADEMTIANYQTQIDILTIQIAEANNRIEQLRQDLLTISNTVDNAVVAFKGYAEHIEYPVFDDNDNFIYFTSSGDSQGNYWEYYGQDLISQWEVHYSELITDVEKGLGRTDCELRIHRSDIYSVKIDHSTYNLQCNGETYLFSETATFEMAITLDGVAYTLDAMMTTIDTNTYYKVIINFDYELDANNYVTSCVMRYTITTIV